MGYDSKIRVWQVGDYWIRWQPEVWIQVLHDGCKIGATYASVSYYGCLKCKKAIPKEIESLISILLPEASWRNSGQVDYKGIE